MCGSRVNATLSVRTRCRPAARCDAAPSRWREHRRSCHAVASLPAASIRGVPPPAQRAKLRRLAADAVRERRAAGPPRREHRPYSQSSAGVAAPVASSSAASDAPKLSADASLCARLKRPKNPVLAETKKHGQNWEKLAIRGHGTTRYHVPGAEYTQAAQRQFKLTGSR